MKNYSNSTYHLHTYWSVPNLVVFEVITVISSFLIIATSSLIVHNFYGKVKKSRAHLLFIILSVSDIGVGLLSQPLLLIQPLCDCKVKCSESTFSMIMFFTLFPYTFSYIVTTIIAIDRLLIVTLQQHYEHLVTKRRLKNIVAFCFALCTGFCFCLTYYMYEVNAAFLHSIVFINAAINIILSCIIITGYAYILCFVFRRSNAMSQCRSNGNKGSKKLTKTVLSIFISQTICIVPHYFLLTGMQLENVQLLIYLRCWFYMLRNNQCFCNGIILLMNQKTKSKKNNGNINRRRRR